MVLHQIAVQHDGITHHLDYDPEDGFEVLQIQLFSLTSVPPEKQKIVDDTSKTYREDSDLARLVSLPNKCTLTLFEEEECGTSSQRSQEQHNAILKADEELARLLQAEEESTFLQQQSGQHGRQIFSSKLQSYISQVMQYEDPTYQQKARDSVPFHELEENAVIALAKEGIKAPKESEIKHGVLFQLLLWFKKFFRWVDAPPCFLCGMDTVIDGMGNPTPEELKFGGSRVELYRCKRCNVITRFPRYNDTAKLIETRIGRCGEWANCFTLYCRALGYQARLVLDFTDHLWTECFSDHLRRWVHMDPCEAVFDKPLLYEQGWKKKLNYTIAFSGDGVYDVTKRYTKNWEEVRTRRNITTEENVAQVVSNLTTQLRSRFKLDVVQQLCERDEKEADDLLMAQQGQVSSLEALPGRQTGSEEWRKARKELGSTIPVDAFKASSPKRLCVDYHVTEIVSSLGDLNVSWNTDSQNQGLEDMVGALQVMLCRLKEAPYRMRKIDVVLSPENSQLFNVSMFGRFLRALSLEQSTSDSKEILIFSKNHVETALALPVALEKLKNLLDSARLGLLRDRLRFLSANVRLHGGFATASAEEEPLGIVSCAFDGLQSTKWEEPNGAGGGWLTYYLPEETRTQVNFYELTSANDCPERDPKDWVLEGSDDGGCTWTVLDTRTSQLFSHRFERQCFEISASKRKTCNALRFRFLAVRDGLSQSRLQLSSIDIYKSKS